MPRDWMNWTCHDVIAFLQDHFFVHVHTRGSHYYFKGRVDNAIRLVEVPYHAQQSIKPRTLRHSIIPKSGIPASIWKKWGNAGNKRARKKITYPGAQEI